MTACNDVQSASFGKKVVGTALAGTLAVGMVPAAALAAPADEAAANDGISALLMTEVQNFEQGTITGVTVGGKAVANPAEVTVSASEMKVVDGATDADPDTYNPQIVVTQVTKVAGDDKVVSLVQANGELKTGVTIQYAKAEAGKTADQLTYKDTLADRAAGAYYAKVAIADTGMDESLKAYPDAVIYLSFTVTTSALTGITAYEPVDGDAENVSDTTFEYTGNEQKIGFQIGGKPLTPTTDYTVTYYGADGKSITGTPTAAGTYTAEIKGADGSTYAGKTAQVSITVGQLNLSTAKIVVNTPNGTDPFAIETINGHAVNAAIYKTAIAPIDNGDAGKYTVTVTPAEDNANVTGSQAVTAYRVSTAVDASDWQYDGQAITWSEKDGAYEASTAAAPVLLSDKNPALVDLSKLTITENNEKLAYTVTVTDAQGNVVPESSLSTPGDWTITATIDSAACNYLYGGKIVIKQSVRQAEIQSSDIVALVNGAISGATTTLPYSGANLLPQIAFTVKSGDKTLVEGTDYTLSITNKADKPVAEIVDVADGPYVITVESKTYEMPDTGNTLTVTVSPVTIKAFQVSNVVAGQDFVAYTGAAITPVIEYSSEVNGKDVWAVLPSDMYTITDIKYTSNEPNAQAQDVTEIKDEGTYSFTVTKNATNTVAGNYDWPQTATCEMKVSAGTNAFIDVNAGDWYYTPVTEAAKNGYMNGYAGTKLFGPNDKITRGQVACVLFNMAGGKAGGVEDDSFTDNEGFKTGFSDVDDHAYYAQAIAWAKQAGVVNGYAGTDKFGPNDNVTREQFAAMLANYAKATNKFVAVEDVAAVLDARPDGSAVSDWAEESVAWAVSNKYMGNAADGVINPLGNITRAEVAAMAVNFQPKPIA